MPFNPLLGLGIITGGNVIGGAISGGWKGALTGLLVLGGAAAAITYGAIKGGWRGALMGVVSTALNAIGSVNNFMKIAVFVAGAGLAYASGGWKGLATFGAGFAGAMVAKGALGGFRSHSEENDDGYELVYKKSRYSFQYKTGRVALNDNVNSDIASDVLPAQQVSLGQANNIAQGLEVPPGLNINGNEFISKNLSIVEFVEHVRSGGFFDYKQLGNEYENFGNFHFGVVGRAAGLSPRFLKFGAGMYQLYQDLTVSNRSIHWENWGTFFDDPIDQYWIQQGIDYYDKN